MDEFKPDNQPQGQNDLRPDTSDRPAGRSRQSTSVKPKITLSRQHIMIGVGVLVLLLLIIAISSALKAPTEHERQQTTSNNTEQNIDLSGSSSLTNTQSQTQPGQAQEITGSQITPTPTQGELQTQPNGLGERIEIPGDVVDALNQGQVPTPGTTQPQNVTPLNPPVVKPVEQQPVVKPVTPERTQPKTVEPKQPTQPKQPTKPAATANNQGSNVMSAPAGSYTLQLSSASRSDTLEAFAKENKLANYKVYKTIRNGQTWYVLIHGNYNSVTDAKNAIGTLPAAVQAKKPWVRNMKQVKQDQK
ncbi:MULTISPECIES: SPOR domain-containing protein [Providencia]|jgi:DamX protein|uniref:SPOR domain-containing protein n=1 Tax=Providencia TaxID=586 RepID=UPI001C5ACCB6|nr:MULTISPECIES: SPOR domain-containing protein [Providencia]MDR2226912.1 SPOR domain-containing protein [Providencia sp.]QXX82067.1 SPOR domain-containing protein [Providencia sp. R33]